MTDPDQRITMPMEMYEEARLAARAMIEWGGSFVKHLGEALLRADVQNMAKIKEAFPEYWNRYLRLAKEQGGFKN
jgi:hypothetical protein